MPTSVGVGKWERRMVSPQIPHTKLKISFGDNLGIVRAVKVRLWPRRPLRLSIQVQDVVTGHR